MTLFGAVVAMLGSNALAGMLRHEMVPAAAGFPVAVAIGLVLAVLTDAHWGLQVLAFPAVLFAAVWVRQSRPLCEDPSYVPRRQCRSSLHRTFLA